MTEHQMTIGRFIEVLRSGQPKTDSLRRQIKHYRMLCEDAANAIVQAYNQIYTLNGLVEQAFKEAATTCREPGSEENLEEEVEALWRSSQTYKILHGENVDSAGHGAHEHDESKGTPQIIGLEGKHE